MSDLIDAIWNGPFAGELRDRETGQMRTIVPGGEAKVSEADLLSEHWQRKEQPQESKSAFAKVSAEPKSDDGSAD